MLPVLVATLGLVLIHLFSYRLRFLDVIPRSRLLSVAGGMSVSYVFLRILPELDRAQARVGFAVGEVLHLRRDAIYLVALVGLVAYYGLERMAEGSRQRSVREGGKNLPGHGVFLLHIAGYALVNVLVGYLLVERGRVGFGRVLLFFVAMALYFLVNDYGLMAQHREMYRRQGRWVLAAALLAGSALGMVRTVSDLSVSLALAFVGGGVIFNVMKEELPRERESRYWAFALGVAFYSALLLSG